MKDIHVYPIRTLKDNYVWAIVNSLKQCLYVVDPGESAPVMDFIEAHQLSLKGILITHHHWDHVHGVDDLLVKYAVPVVGARHSPFPLLTHLVSGGDCVELDVALPKLQVLDIPGHTLDHIAYYDEGRLFCGDTLFGGGCGRIFEGTGSMLYASLQKLSQLPDDTRIYCAHEYTLLNLQFAHCVEPDYLPVQQRIVQTKQYYQQGLASLPSLLQLEKETNPFLRCKDLHLQQAVEAHVGRALYSPEDVFIALRHWKDNFVSPDLP